MLDRSRYNSQQGVAVNEPRSHGIEARRAVSKPRLGWAEAGLYAVVAVIVLVVGVNLYRIQVAVDPATFTGVGVVLLCYAVIVCVVAFVRSVRCGVRRPTSLVALGSVVTILGFPLYKANLSTFVRENFEARRTDREIAVETFIKGNLAAREDIRRYKPNSPGVSADGWVYVYQNGGDVFLFFPVLMWWVDDHMGFVYSRSGEPPPVDAFWHITSAERIERNWFWISTT